MTSLPTTPPTNGDEYNRDSNGCCEQCSVKADVSDGHETACGNPDCACHQGVFWLIERGQQVNHFPTVWLQGADKLGSPTWTEDASRAMRFNDKQSAEAHAYKTSGKGLYTVTSHKFIDASLPTNGGTERRVAQRRIKDTGRGHDECDHNGVSEERTRIGNDRRASPTSSGTPRTDALIAEFKSDDSGLTSTGIEFRGVAKRIALAEHARQLEEELATSQQNVRALREAQKANVHTILHLRAALNEACACGIAAFVSYCNPPLNAHKQGKIERLYDLKALASTTPTDAKEDGDEN